MTVEEISHPGPLIKSLLINQDADGLPCDELGRRIYKVIEDKNCAFAKIEPWWLNEEEGVWQQFAFFHSDFDTDDAYHITRLSNKGFFGRVKRERIDDERGIAGGTSDIFIPKSVIEYGYHAGEMERDDIPIFDDFTRRRGKVSDADIVFGQELRIRDDDGDIHIMIQMDCPYEAKDDIKNLDYSKTLRQWNADKKCWMVKADSISLVLRYFMKEGYKIALNQSALRSSYVEDIDVDS